MLSIGLSLPGACPASKPRAVGEPSRRSCGLPIRPRTVAGARGPCYRKIMVARVARAIALGGVLGLGFAACRDEEPVPEACMVEDNLELFERRIAPLFADDHPSTCNECHLAGVELGLYARGDECRTMACMVEEGIVDLDTPEDSVVLGWILRGTPDSALITDDVIQAEHDAMLEWIEFQSQCNGALCDDYDDPCGHGPHAGDCDIPASAHDLPPREFEDPGDCSDRTLELAFEALVYSWRGRCNPCHYDTFDGNPEDAPRWIAIGDCNAGSLATMRTVVREGYVDATDPAGSLLLLKPLAESAGGVEHGGSDKFLDATDSAYQDFRRWIERWSACQNAPG